MADSTNSGWATIAIHVIRQQKKWLRYDDEFLDIRLVRTLRQTGIVWIQRQYETQPLDHGYLEYIPSIPLPPCSYKGVTDTTVGTGPPQKSDNSYTFSGE